jgi:hypothetical protein
MKCLPFDTSWEMVSSRTQSCGFFHGARENHAELRTRSREFGV